MKKIVLFVLYSLFCFSSFAQYAPVAGHIGTSAIHKDSSVFVAWANGCTVIRGYQNCANHALGYASVGDSSKALGKAGNNSIVSLGDGGSAIVTFANPIQNGAGWDFAVFENSFNDTFLELAFVEVSSDGNNFYRFPATSNTQDTVQIKNSDSIDATQINNLAGKYRALYGTPFDLDELIGKSGLDVNNITHVKMIDVVGSIQNIYASYDHNGHKINDPWTTAFASGGFDLDAVGVIHQVPTGINESQEDSIQLNVFPNPLKSTAVIQYYLDKNSDAIISITDMVGTIVYSNQKTDQSQGLQSIEISGLTLENGIYFLKVEINNKIAVQKIIISK